MANPDQKVLSHFRDRSARYNQSSNWVGDARLLGSIVGLSGVEPGDTVLDVATGTGLVARAFRGKAKAVLGLDVSPEMTRLAEGCHDRLLIAPVEAIPLEAASVDVLVCRQGLQFADLPKAAAEIFRVLRPGGRAVLCHLCAYGADDEKEAFRIQALRNPARVNFFKPGDLEKALGACGLKVTRVDRYPSRESIAKWIGHGAISEEQQKAIVDAYRSASPEFKRIHRVEFAGDDVFDTMLFLLIRAEKPA